jgi:hypothetical protein
MFKIVNAGASNPIEPRIFTLARV